MEEIKFKFMWGSICFIVFWIGLIFMGSWVNTPTDYKITFDIQTDNETIESLNAIAKISESQDQQCIVKEWELYINEGLEKRYLINEYLIDNCSYTKK